MMNDFFNRLKSKYNYSDEFIKILSDIMYSFVVVLGENNLDKIIYVFENTFIYEFENVKEAGDFATTYFNNGKSYTFGVQATGSGVTEDDYYLDNNGKINQQILVLIQKGEYSEKIIQTLIHELSHAISSINGFEFDGNILHTVSGLSSTLYEFDGKSKGKIISSTGGMFNEIITENIAMQVMDIYNNQVIHNASAYNGWTERFKKIFRNDNINSIIINDYLNHTNNFLEEFTVLFNQEDIRNAIDYLYTVIDLNNITLKEYLDTLYNMTVNDFFEKYIEYINYFTGRPEGIDRETFKTMRLINEEIIVKLCDKLELNKSL